MALLNFGLKDVPAVEVNPQVETFLKDFSIEVMPRTAEKVEDFRDFLPGATRG
jgi:methylenetetrahydrofolate reductase (NADPH)